RFQQRTVIRYDLIAVGANCIGSVRLSWHTLIPPYNLFRHAQGGFSMYIMWHHVRKVLFVLAAGALFGIATGCDPTARSTIIGGFDQLTSSFVHAFFQI